MLRGEPDRFIANLDGGGLRLPDEANPVAIGAGPDSMLRAENLQRVLDAAGHKEGNRVIDVRHLARARERLAREGRRRQVRLDYGYEAQLTNRDVQGPQRRAARDGRALEGIDAGARSRGWPATARGSRASRTPATC